MLSSIEKRLAFTASLLAVVIALGSLGFALIEGWSFQDALFMTVISVSTVGYGEVHPLSPAGRIFAMGVILTGMGILAYGLSSITAFAVEGELTNIIERRKMEKEISKLTDHIVLCGLGQTGRHVAEELIKTKTPFIAIECHPEVIQHRKSLGHFPYIQGDATQAQVLLQANIKEARGLVTTLGSDKDNLFVIISAKELNPNLRVVTRAIEDDAGSKLAKVGADAIVSTNHIGGLRMASEMVRPTVVSFLDVMLRDPQRVIRIEEARVEPESKLAGLTLRECQVKEKTGLLIIALKKAATGSYVYNPVADTLIEAQDWLIVCGSLDQMSKLRQLARGG